MNLTPEERQSFRNVDKQLGIKTREEKEAAVAEIEDLGVAGTIKKAVANIGGVEELTAWARSSDRNRRELFGWYAKLAQKEENDQGVKVQVNIVNYNGDPDTTTQVYTEAIPATPV
jgi:hypothetical protein|tara:strand:- start:683 stop:1030 length:348 start_codon:yes stop_codon:yes gene_type:complete